MENENYVYRLYQTMSSGALAPVTYHRRLTPGHRKASKEARQAFTAAAAGKYAAVNGIDVTAVKCDKVRTIGGRPSRGEEI
jgi:hypothetical protein